MKDQSRHRRTVPIKLALGAAIGSLLGVAINVASDESSWPWPLRWVQQYPWLSVLIFTAGAWYYSYWDRRTKLSQEPASVMAVRLLESDSPFRSVEQVRARRDLIEEVRRVWIHGVLNRSLAEVVRVRLNLAEDLAVVRQPWVRLVRAPGFLEPPMPKEVSITEAAKRFGGRLLILGDPGSGKSTLLLEHARDLLDEAAQDSGARIPVVFHLSAWPDSQPPLAEWLATELAVRYGIRPDRARSWVEHDMVTPLLDGLDEVRSDRRVGCVAAINAFRRDHGQVPILVCSRTRDYKDLADKLELEGAIVIEPLSRAQVKGWLQDMGESLSGLRTVLLEDQQLWELLDTPLMLSIFALTYKDQPPAAIRFQGSIDQRRKHLFISFTNSMLRRPRAPLAPERGRSE